MSLLTIKTNTGQTLDIDKVVKIRSDKKMLYIEEMKNGGMRLTYSGGLLETTKGINVIEIKRGSE